MKQGHLFEILTKINEEESEALQTEVIAEKVTMTCVLPKTLTLIYILL